MKRPEINEKAKKLILEKMATDIATSQNKDFKEVLKILNSELLKDEDVWELNQQEFQTIAKKKIKEGFDKSLINILSSFWFYKNKVMDNLVEEWVTNNDIKPTQNIGDKTIVAHKNKNYIGEITNFIKKYGRYSVSIKEFEHDVLVNYEDFKPISKNFKIKS